MDINKNIHEKLQMLVSETNSLELCEVPQSTIDNFKNIIEFYSEQSKEYVSEIDQIETLIKLNQIQILLASFKRLDSMVVYLKNDNIILKVNIFYLCCFLRKIFRFRKDISDQMIDSLLKVTQKTEMLDKEARDLGRKSN